MLHERRQAVAVVTVWKGRFSQSRQTGSGDSVSLWVSTTASVAVGLLADINGGGWINVHRHSCKSFDSR